MTNETRLSWPRYIAAAAMVLCAGLFRLLLAPVFDPDDGGFALYLLALVGAAVVGGLPTCLWAMALSLVCVMPCIVGPDGTALTMTPQNLTQLVLFSIAGLLIGGIGQHQRQRRKPRTVATHAELASFVESALDAILVVDGGGRILFSNRTAQKIFNLSRLAVTRTPITDLIPEWPKHVRYAEIGPNGSEPHSVFFDIRAVRDNAAFPIEASIASTPYADDRVYITIIRDITRRKEVDAERESLLRSEQEARSMAERATRMKDEFLATVSHELRTPLNAIMGWSQMLRRPGCDEQLIMTAMEAVYRNAKIQAQLIEDILDVSRIVSGKLRLQLRPADLNMVVRNAVDAVRHSAEAKTIALVELYDQAHPICLIDPDRIQQVVWNLVSNAVKFTPEGGTITVRISRDDHLASIEISDTGEGIAVDFLPYVFDRFRQADSSTSRRHNGLGLGLAISRHLIEMHGGTIVAESAGIGQGARFLARFPYAEVKDTTASGIVLSHDMPISGLRLLIIDDNEEQRDLATMLLKSHGASVQAAESAAEARRFLNSFRPDVIVADISMPDEDGIVFIRRLRETGPWHLTPAIALTAHTRQEDRERVLRAGYDRFVSKPFEIPALLEVISSIVRRTDGVVQTTTAAKGTVHE